MPRAMRRYQSGIKTVNVQRWLDCPVEDCGRVTFRAKTFTGPLADQDAAAWQPEPRCLAHLRAAKRAAVGL